MIVLGGAGVVGAIARPPTRHAAAVTVTLRQPLPGVVRAGTPVTIAGRVTGAPAVAVAVLEGLPRAARGGSGGTLPADAPAPAGTTVLARTRLRHGSFTLHWTPSQAGFVVLRVAVRVSGHDVAATAAPSVLVGAAPVYCAPAPAPAKGPAGEGWLIGGMYIAGGPAPGIYACGSQPYTETVTDASGDVVATQAVAGGQSYSIALAPGTYDLSTDVSSVGYCRGTATITAGRETHADTVCAVP